MQSYSENLAFSGKRRKCAVWCRLQNEWKVDRHNVTDSLNFAKHADAHEQPRTVQAARIPGVGFPFTSEFHKAYTK